MASALVVLTVLGVGSASPAFAADDRRALLEAGKAQRMTGDEVGALASFSKAHQLGPTPESSGLMGASEYNLSRWVDAEIHLTEALRAKDDPWVTRHRVKLTQLLATVRTQLGWVEITGTPLGAEVEVAGRAVGRLPLPRPVRVAGGEVNVRVAAPGYKIARRDLDVTYDQVTRISIDLEKPGASEAAEGRGAPGGGRRGGVGGTSPELDNAITTPRSSVNAYRTAGWVTAGAAVVLAGVGIAALISKESNTNQFNDYNKNLGDDKKCNEAFKNAGGGPCPTYLDRMRTARMIAYVALAGAGLSAVVSGILLSVPSPADSASTGRHVAKAAPACLPSFSSFEGNAALGGACSFTF